MRLLQAVPAVFMICLAVGVLAGTAGLNLWDGFTPGARFFPAWLAGAGVLLSAALLLTQWRGTDAGELDLPDRTGAMRVLATVVGLVGFALLTTQVGLMPSLILFVLYMLLGVLRAPLWPSILTAAVLAVGVEGIFVRWLAVPLPVPNFF